MTKLNAVPTMSFLKKLASKGPIAPIGIWAITALFSLLAVWAQVIRIITSGIYDKEGNLIFYGSVLFHDSNVHLSLISELLHRFPPTNFSYFFEGEQVLKNYHYFFDILLALCHQILLFSTIDLYYRIFPILISLSLSTVIFLTTLRLTKSKIAAAFSIFFTIFATSLGSTLPIIKTIFAGNHVTGGSNIFMTDQILDILVNPHGALSLVMFLALFLLISNYEQSKKKINLAFFALLLAASFGLKAYGGIVFAIGASVVFLLGLLRKDRLILASVITGLGLMGIWILFSINKSVSGMLIAPFWTIEKMVVDLDRINEPTAYTYLIYYQAAHNWIKIAIWYLFFTSVYILGSMGLRIIGLWEFLSPVKKIKQITYSEAFILVSATASFVIPIIFNQAKKAYDVVQFTPYFTLLSGIFFTVTLFRIVHKFKSNLLRSAILLSIVSIFLLISQMEFSSRLNEFQNRNEKIVISKEIISGMTFIRNNTPENAVFLLAPSDFNLRFSWFPSLSERRTVYSGRGFAFQVGVDTTKAEKKLDNIFEGKEKFENFQYVYLTKNEEAQFARIKEMYNLQEVYRNNGVAIFRKGKSI